MPVRKLNKTSGQSFTRIGWITGHPLTVRRQGMGTLCATTLRRLIVVWFFALAISTFATDYQWPQRAAGPYPWPEGKDAQTTLSERFTRASQKTLGSEADIAAIKKAILDHLHTASKKLAVHEIRWLSATLVMADAGWYSSPEASADYFYVVEKKKDKWQIVTYYLRFIS